MQGFDLIRVVMILMTLQFGFFSYSRIRELIQQGENIRFLELSALILWFPTIVLLLTSLIFGFPYIISFAK